MTLTGNLFSQVVGHAFGLNTEKLVHWIEERFTDHSQALPKALAHANDCAWHAVGLALAGDSFFDWFKDVFRSRDVTAIRNEIREFLAATPTGLEDSPPAVRVRAWKEWQCLRKAGRFSTAGMSAKEVTRPAAAMQRYGAGRRSKRPDDSYCEHSRCLKSPPIPSLYMARDGHFPGFAQTAAAKKCAE